MVWYIMFKRTILVLFIVFMLTNCGPKVYQIETLAGQEILYQAKALYHEAILIITAIVRDRIVTDDQAGRLMEIKAETELLYERLMGAVSTSDSDFYVKNAIVLLKIILEII